MSACLKTKLYLARRMQTSRFPTRDATLHFGGQSGNCLDGGSAKTLNDSFQWEVHRLDAENRRLRSGNPEANDRLDQEAELEQTKADAVELTEQLQAYKKQLKEHAEA